MATTPLQREKGDKAASPGVGYRTPVVMEPRVGSALKDEAIWKRLRDAGGLIAYIGKLESEIYDYQHHMGLLILEKKQWISKYEQVKASADSAEMVNKRELAAHLSALSESKKQEENLKKAIGIEKESIASLEKTIHEIRAQSAEAKVAAESKLSEAHTIMENAQKKFDEAQKKLRDAESSCSEARRYERMAAIKLHEVEAREDELRRRLVLFNSQCDSREKDISLERQSLYDSQKIMQEEQEKLLERQACLNQREEHVFGRLEELAQFEKQLEIAKRNLEVEQTLLKEEKSNFALDVRALATREESVIERESLLDKKQKELLILQEKHTIREQDEIQRLKTDNERLLELRMSEFEAKLEQRRKEVDEEIENKRLACKQRETDLSQRTELIQERENALELQSAELTEKYKIFEEKLKLLEEKELSLAATEKTAEKKMLDMEKEKVEIKSLTLELEKVKELLEAEKNEVLRRKRNLIYLPLKEEIDSFRAQQAELMVEADKLKEEKEKFEREWDLIDEKRVELQREADRIAEDRKSVCQYLKNEQESLKAEKEDLRNQFKGYYDSLSHEREQFISNMEREHSEWFSKIQKEREDLMEDMKLQKQELENSIRKRRDEVDGYLREKEEGFEREKTNELQQIYFQKERIAKELEHLATEVKKFEDEKTAIALDREHREKEWSEIKCSIDVLNLQREKLQRQRELLQTDRQEIFSQIQHLRKLEDQCITSEHKSLSDSAKNDALVNYANLQSAEKRMQVTEKKKVGPVRNFHQEMDWRLNSAWRKKSNLREAEDSESSGRFQDADKSRPLIDADVEEIIQYPTDGLHSSTMGKKRLNSSPLSVDGDVHLEPFLKRQKESNELNFVNEFPVAEVTSKSGSVAFDRTSEGSEMCEPCFEEVPAYLRHAEEIESSGCCPKGEEALMADNVESGVHNGDDPSSNGQPLLKQPKDMLKRDSSRSAGPSDEVCATSL
ncbi:unnamed protein product [Spirodela intermedia]|uniref:Uncharacterized protein n=1 Tax=Spirodela intermedia TaxID=51605 RepID=A0A7I8I8V1_SPIIN|nr:unnamed protein product [Spirodela intermedia]CAA6653492.1 unnamed protein product [Spirodela intermedia]